MKQCLITEGSQLNFCQSVVRVVLRDKENVNTGKSNNDIFNGFIDEIK